MEALREKHTHLKRVKQQLFVSNVELEKKIKYLTVDKEQLDSYTGAVKENEKIDQNEIESITGYLEWLNATVQGNVRHFKKIRFHRMFITEQQKLANNLWYSM